MPEKRAFRASACVRTPLSTLRLCGERHTPRCSALPYPRGVGRQREGKGTVVATHGVFVSVPCLLPSRRTTNYMKQP